MSQEKNLNIVNVHKQKAIKHVSEQVIHQHLEDSRSIGETKGHDQPLKMSFWFNKSRLSLVDLTNAHEMVRVAEVQFSQKTSLVKGSECSINERKRIFILDGDVI